MSVVNGYCSVEEVRSQLGDIGSKLNTALLERAVSAASRAVDRYCGRRFWQDQVPVARQFDPADAYCALVDDISTKVGLVVQTDSIGTGTYATTLSSDDYRLEPLNADTDGTAYAWTRIMSQRPWLQSCSTGALRSPYLQVTARWGWSAIPDDVAEATILKATSLFSRKDAPFGIAGFGEFGVRISRRDPDVVELLSPYQLAGIA